jgi:hypothetical protein
VVDVDVVHADGLDADESFSPGRNRLLHRDVLEHARVAGPRYSNGVHGASSLAILAAFYHA